MCEDHDQARIEQHVIIHMSVVTRHHDNCLLPWHPLTYVAFIMAPIHLQRIHILNVVKEIRDMILDVFYFYCFTEMVFSP